MLLTQLSTCTYIDSNSNEASHKKFNRTCSSVDDVIHPKATPFNDSPKTELLSPGKFESKTKRN